MAEVTKAQVRAAVSIVIAISETIREVKEVASSTLYAQLMGAISFEEYTKIIDMLKRTDLVKEENHVLKWAGPNIPPSLPTVEVSEVP